MAPNYSDIQYFLEVARTGNISRAAERLGITQPSLSNAIKRLESGLGVDLLVRGKTGVQLTKSGLELQNQGRELIGQWEEVVSEVRGRADTVSGDYSIGCHPSVALYTIPLFTKELLKNYPGLNLQFHHDLSRKVTESVVSFKTDFGIVVNPVAHPDLVITPLCKDEVKFWSSAKPTSLQDPRGENAVLICDLELSQVQSLLQKAKRSGLKFSRVVTSQNLEVVTELVASGAGIGVLPQRVAQRAVTKKLKPLSEQPQPFKDQICLVYRADQPKTKARQTVINTIKTAFKDQL